MKHTPEHVVLIRPGCTDYDEESRIQGTLDLPMNERGNDQLASVIATIRDLNIELILTGPNEPGLSVAREIGAELAIPVKEKAGLDNLDQGLWQGLQIDEIRRKYPRVYRRWQDSPESIRPPEGETLEEAQLRIEDVLDRPLRRKAPFAVVASEPLATLVRHVVEDTPVDQHHPICGCRDPLLVELLHPGQGPRLASDNSGGHRTQPGPAGSTQPAEQQPAGSGLPVHVEPGGHEACTATHIHPRGRGDGSR